MGHRTMYQTFVRICARYTRWKRAFTVERERALLSQQGLRRDTNVGRRFSTSQSARQNSLAILSGSQGSGDKPEKSERGDRKSVKVAQNVAVTQSRGRRSTFFFGDHAHGGDHSGGSVARASMGASLGVARQSMSVGNSSARTARISEISEAH